MARQFKRPKGGSFRHYCGECAHWAPVDEKRDPERLLDGLGVCEYDGEPTNPVGIGYYMNHVCIDQYRGACPLWEKVGA